jgi:hypothetical protein
VFYLQLCEEQLVATEIYDVARFSLPAHNTQLSRAPTQTTNEKKKKAEQCAQK